MARNLASVQVILEISPIPDADAIEIATVLRYKNQWFLTFLSGSFCLYRQPVPE